MTVFIIQYSHPGRDFEGWYNLRAFTTLEAAERALEIERGKGPEYRYCINAYKVETE